MTPQEKAKELVEKMYFSRRYKDNENYIPKEAWIHAKQCALIAVDEIIFVASKYNDTQAEVSYWQEVKQEIEKL
jgi:hypothetical protein